MVDLQTVCCMCGDVGFPDKLFRCSKCCNRFQHSYCSNYYRECAEAIQVCDWCQCEEMRNPPISISASSSKHPSRNTKHANSNSNANSNEVRSVYSGDKIKHQPDKPTGKPPSPRPSPRRYKLLKDVMC